MIAGGIEKGVERSTTMEWSTEINIAEEASDMKCSGMDATTEAFEPGGGVVEMTPTRCSEAHAIASIMVKGRFW